VHPQTDKNYLHSECSNPDTDKEVVAEDAFEHISLSMDLPGIYLVEKRHHDECVEYDAEVLRRLCVEFCLSSATVDVQKPLSCEM